MASYLFFDDNRLLVREGFEREVGKPRLIPDSQFAHDGSAMSGAMARVWQESENSFHMFYHVFMPDGSTPILAAHSTDGIHFAPRNTAREAGIASPVYENQLLAHTHGELAAFIDTQKSPGRLKLLISEYAHMKVIPRIYESDDGIHWVLTPHSWHNRGTEPCASLLYSSHLQEYVLLCRPMWGVRRVYESRTRDFVSFTPPAPMMQADAIDPPLTESYGLFGFPYKDMYVGFLTLYLTVSSNTWKFVEGDIQGQLAYSFDGAHWQRTIRQPIMHRPQGGMVFTSDMRQDVDGSLLLYASSTPRAHGHFREPGGALGVYRLREDGFICLRTETGGRMRTRETLLQGAFDINLHACNATCALYTDADQPIPGFTHTDCQPFTGDCTHWQPVFTRDLAELTGQIVTIEIKMDSGRLYAINGRFTPFFNTEAWRWREGIV